MTPEISIIVPIYNVERYLDECLRSIEAQTFSDIEIICVNDGSTDSSPDIVREHASRDPRIHMIDKPNAGYGHSINRGIEAARGRYIGIVESDDWIEPDMFETLHARAEEHELDIVRVNYWLYWSVPEPRNEFFESYFAAACDRVFDPRDFTECFYYPPALWAMLVRRDLIEENGLRLRESPGASFQDTSFSFKLWACAHRTELVHDAYLHYRQDNESSSINNPAKAYFVCDEYAEIERFLREDIADGAPLLPVAVKRKFDAYVWNLSRIAQDLRPEFAERAAAELSAAKAEGILDESLFSLGEKRRLERLLADPSAFAANADAEAAEEPPSFLKRIYRKLVGK